MAIFDTSIERTAFHDGHYRTDCVHYEDIYQADIFRYRETSLWDVLTQSLQDVDFGSE